MQFLLRPGTSLADSIMVCQPSRNKDHSPKSLTSTQQGDTSELNLRITKFLVLPKTSRSIQLTAMARRYRATEQRISEGRAAQLLSLSSYVVAAMASEGTAEMGVFLAPLSVRPPPRQKQPNTALQIPFLPSSPSFILMHSRLPQCWREKPMHFSFQQELNYVCTWAFNKLMHFEKYSTNITSDWV